MVQASNGISLSSGLHSVTGVQLRDQFSCGNDYAPKVFTFSVFFMLYFCSEFLLMGCFCVNRLGNHTQSQNKEKDGRRKSIRSFLML